MARALQRNQTARCAGKPAASALPRAFARCGNSSLELSTRRGSLRPYVRLNGRRAVNEFYLVLHQGRLMDGYEFDFQTWSVTLDLLEKRDGAWKISRRSMIYEKSRMDPRVPGSVPQSYYDGLDLSKYPEPVKFHCYRNERLAGHAPRNLILKGSPEEKAARQAAAEWLAG